MLRNKSFTGVILAGGKSSRMGRNKALLPYGKGTLIEYVRHTLIAAGADEVIISGEIPGYDGVPDLFPERGPIGGIVSVLNILTEGRILFTAVDCPKLNTQTIQSLLERGSAGLASHFSAHPLPFLLNMTDAVSDLIRHKIMPTLTSENISVQQLLSLLQARSIPTTPVVEQSLMNTNTPDEWKKVVA